MDHRFQLCGSVKPYFGRSIHHQTAPAEQPAQVSVQPTPVPVVTVQATPVPPQLSPKGLIYRAARLRNWVVESNVDAFDVTVPIAGHRQQVVSIDVSRRDPAGNPLLVLMTRCGPAKNINMLALLRRNARLLQSAFAVQKTGTTELIVLRGSLRADIATVEELVGSIEAIASYADRVEQKLVGTDEY